MGRLSRNQTFFLLVLILAIVGFAAQQCAPAPGIQAEYKATQLAHEQGFDITSKVDVAHFDDATCYYYDNQFACLPKCSP